MIDLRHTNHRPSGKNENNRDSKCTHACTQVTRVRRKQEAEAHFPTPTLLGYDTFRFSVCGQQATISTLPKNVLGLN